MAEDDDGHARLHPAPLDAEERAGQGLGECRAGGGQPGAERDHIPGHEARRQGDVLAVGPVDEEQVLAEVGPARPAEPAMPTRGRVGRDDPVALPDAGHAAAHRGHHPGQLVTEDGRHVRDHHRVAAPQGLHVSAAGERGLHPDHETARSGLGHRDLLEAEVAGAVEDLRAHARA